MRGGMDVVTANAAFRAAKAKNRGRFIPKKALPKGLPKGKKGFGPLVVIAKGQDKARLEPTTSSESLVFSQDSPRGSPGAVLDPVLESPMDPVQVQGPLLDSLGRRVRSMPHANQDLDDAARAAYIHNFAASLEGADAWSNVINQAVVDQRWGAAIEQEGLLGQLLNEAQGTTIMNRLDAVATHVVMGGPTARIDRGGAYYLKYNERGISVEKWTPAEVAQLMDVNGELRKIDISYLLMALQADAKAARARGIAGGGRKGRVQVGGWWLGDATTEAGSLVSKLVNSWYAGIITGLFSITVSSALIQINDALGSLGRYFGGDTRTREQRKIDWELKHQGDGEVYVAPSDHEWEAEQKGAIGGALADVSMAYHHANVWVGENAVVTVRGWINDVKQCAINNPFEPIILIEICKFIGRVMAMCGILATRALVEVIIRGVYIIFFRWQVNMLTDGLDLASSDGAVSNVLFAGTFISLMLILWCAPSFVAGSGPAYVAAIGIFMAQLILAMGINFKMFLLKMSGLAIVIYFTGALTLTTLIVAGILDTIIFFVFGIDLWALDADARPLALGGQPAATPARERFIEHVKKAGEEIWRDLGGARPDGAPAAARPELLTHQVLGWAAWHSLTAVEAEIGAAGVACQQVVQRLADSVGHMYPNYVFDWATTDAGSKAIIVIIISLFVGAGVFSIADGVGGQMLATLVPAGLAAAGPVAAVVGGKRRTRKKKRKSKKKRKAKRKSKRKSKKKSRRTRRKQK